MCVLIEYKGYMFRLNQLAVIKPNHRNIYIYIYIYIYIVFPWRNCPSGQRPPHYRGFTITLNEAHHTWLDSSGRGISPTQRPLFDNAQHSQETYIHATGGIRAHNPSKRSAADERLIPRGL